MSQKGENIWGSAGLARQETALSLLTRAYFKKQHITHELEVRTLPKQRELCSTRKELNLKIIMKQDKILFLSHYNMTGQCEFSAFHALNILYSEKRIWYIGLIELSVGFHIFIISSGTFVERIKLLVTIFFVDQ